MSSNRVRYVVLLGVLLHAATSMAAPIPLGVQRRDLLVPRSDSTSIANIVRRQNSPPEESSGSSDLAPTPTEDPSELSLFTGPDSLGSGDGDVTETTSTIPLPDALPSETASNEPDARISLGSDGISISLGGTDNKVDGLVDNIVDDALKSVENSSDITIIRIETTGDDSEAAEALSPDEAPPLGEDEPSGTADSLTPVSTDEGSESTDVPSAGEESPTRTQPATGAETSASSNTNSVPSPDEPLGEDEEESTTRTEPSGGADTPVSSDTEDPDSNSIPSPEELNAAGDADAPGASSSEPSSGTELPSPTSTAEIPELEPSSGPGGVSTGGLGTPEIGDDKEKNKVTIIQIHRQDKRV